MEKNWDENKNDGSEMFMRVGSGEYCINKDEDLDFEREREEKDWGKWL